MCNKGYVDIHTHILPGVDDGSKDMNMSENMLRMAYEQGIRTIYATPHYGSGKEKYDRDYLMEQYEKIKEMALHTGEDGIKLLLGNEIYYGNDSVEDIKSGKALTMNNTKYVLVEFDVGVRYKDMYAGLQKLVLAGYRPILAHIERYDCLFRQYDKLYNLNNLGVSMQINASSVISKFDRTAMFCRKVIYGGYIGFLGSDCHRIEWRPPCMESGVTVLKKKTSASIMDKLLHINPEKLYNNEFI